MMRTLSAKAARRWGGERLHPAIPWRVREGTAPYEDEGSLRQARGAVPVGRDAWWAVSLTVPVRDARPDGRLALVRLERHGASAADVPRVPPVDLLVPGDEVDALAALLAGVVAQARRDAVLVPLSAPVPPP
jgi:hypothetical protein